MAYSGDVTNSMNPGGGPAHSFWVPVQGVAARADQQKATDGNYPVLGIGDEPKIHLGDSKIFSTSTYQNFGNAPGPVKNLTP